MLKLGTADSDLRWSCGIGKGKMETLKEKRLGFSDRILQASLIFSLKPASCHFHCK